ncbi:peptidoglycan-associated lipoprotein Pal [Candidatus Ruminimicrobium bovinum]|uniref:peptidoglycan-associated lipoprotein Pal n=1 Tax=Candidatus Ruminimicrobium bovinum TaxID=3242779 RepID=UPI0039B8670B
MKNLSVIMLLALCLCIGACAKKQTTNPDGTLGGDDAFSSQGEPISIDDIRFTDEPSLRNSATDKRAGLATIYFDYDSNSITEEAKEILKENAKYLKNNANLKLVVEGHCDERGTSEYNLSLGQRRALKVKEYYVQLGILPSRIATISYGEEKPEDKRSNESAWAKNRRAETKVIVK